MVEFVHFYKLSFLKKYFYFIYFLFFAFHLGEIKLLSESGKFSIYLSLKIKISHLLIQLKLGEFFLII